MRDWHSLFLTCLNLIKYESQFIKFCLLGIGNTIISLVIYYLFILINSNLYVVGYCVGFLISVCNAYYWNSHHIFGESAHKVVLVEKRAFLKTYVSYILTLALGTLFMYILVDIINITEYLAPIINILLTTPVNFLLNKYWVYHISCE